MPDLTDDEVDALFTGFEHTAFRLEPRESYAGVTYGTNQFARWLAGDAEDWSAVDWSWLEDWLEDVRAARQASKRFERVRIVSEPWSDYTRYGLWSSQITIDAGEDIRYLARHQAKAVGLPAELPGYDYWLLDSRMLLLIHYDNATNSIVRWEFVDDPAAIVQHNYWRDTAWHHALPRDEYVRQHGGEAVLKPPAHTM
jgi:hypothetical protein